MNRPMFPTILRKEDIQYNTFYHFEINKKDFLKMYSLDVTFPHIVIFKNIVWSDKHVLQKSALFPYMFYFYALIIIIVKCRSNLQI